MAVRDIVQIGHPVLRKHSSKVTHFDGALKNLADDMLETMQAANGAGLAAPQVGVSRRLIVVEMPEDDSYSHPGEQWVICNPEIVKASRETEVGQEGCLSVLGYVGLVERPVEVIVRGQDLHGFKMRIKADGFLARAFQHEIDHLDGVLYVDRAQEDSVMTLEAFEELARAQMEEDEAREPAVP